MNTRKRMLWLACGVVSLAGCTTKPDQYYLTVLDPDQTPKTYVTSEPPSWSGGYVHVDLAPLEDDIGVQDGPVRGGALAYNPVTKILHYAFFYPNNAVTPTEAAPRRLHVIDGLGSSNWSSVSASIDIPPPGLSRARAPNMTYLGDKLFGLVWKDSGTIRTALFDESANTIEALSLGPEFDGSEATGIPSIIKLGQQILVYWQNRQGVPMLSAVSLLVENGQLVAGQPLNIEMQAAGSLESKSSNVVVVNGQAIVAEYFRTGTELSWRLHHSDDGSTWVQDVNCTQNLTSPARIVDHLYEYEGNIFGLGDTYSPNGSDALGQLFVYDFTNCARTDLDIPVHRLFSRNSLVQAR